MGLPPLEYIDCFLDSPNFREIISLYEKELDENAHHVKALVRECKHMIQATEEFSKVQSSFAQVLGNFRFQTIGEQTEDERMITNSLQTFARLLFNIEDCRHNMLSTISVRLLQTLERFRKEQIQKAKDEKRRFDRSSHNYYEALQKHLSVSTKKKDISEADSTLEREHAGYRQSAFDYVCKLQDVHAQKQYELIEPIIGYISDVSTFLHQAYDSAGSIKPELQAVQFKVQILRDTHLNEQEKAYELKAQVIEEGEAGLVHHPDFLRQGNLFVQDNIKKVTIGTQWHRYFCQFRKKDIGGKKIRQIRFTPIGHQGNLPSQDFMEVRDCVRSKSEDVDRRFCFDLELQSLHGSHKYVVQGTSRDNRKGWLESMEGKEPVYSSLKVMEIGGVNENGISFVQKCLDLIESRGLDEEGLYRKPGVLSKATKLVKECIEKGKTHSMNMTDEFEWDTKTLASAVKMYLNKQLGEPLFTFVMHHQFIDAAKIPDHEKRVCAIRELCDQLPPLHRKLTAIIMWHLHRVAAASDVNLMKASNIGVCFGPTLMRPERESVATIVDIKYQNIIVAVMVDNVEEIFSGSGSGTFKRDSDSEPPDVPPPPIPTAPSSRKPREFEDSCGYRIPSQIISTPSNPSNRGSRSSVGGITKPPPPPVPASRTSSSAGLKEERSPSPEPYEVPLKIVDGDKRRPPPIPPGGMGAPPPVPKYKPQIPENKKRSYSSASQAPEPNHKPLVGAKRHSRIEPPAVPPTKPPENSPPPKAPLRAHKRARSARALYDCQAEDDLELSFKKDEVLYNVTQSEEPDWMQASRQNGKQGLVPANYLEIL